MDRFNKFTDRARKVLTLAQDEAKRFNHSYIGTEHLLLGLLRVGDGVAANVLTGIGVDLLEARRVVEFIVGRGDRPTVGEVGLTPRAKRVIELAIDESRRLGHDYIGTEHLLLGLVREGEGIASGVLESLGVNLDKVRHEVIHVLGETPPGFMNDTSDVSSWAAGVGAGPDEIRVSPLARAIGIGQVAVDAGVSVELIALEIRGAGCLLHWKAHPAEGRLLGQPRCAIHDDTGTPYEVLSVAWRGDKRECGGEVAVTPGPPAGSTTMHVDISGFAVPGHMWTLSREVRGAWHFGFAIGG